MPYLPVELDAVPKFDLVDAGSSLSPGTTARGMLLLWGHVFRTEKPTVSELQLKAFFLGSGQEFPAVMAAFGFLDPIGGGEHRVKGADRLLAGKLARRAGGLAAKENLKRGAIKPGPSRAPAGGPAPAELPAAPGSAPAQPGVQPELHLTPNTQHLTPLEEEAGSDMKIGVKLVRPDRRKPPPANPRLRPLSDRLVSAFLRITGEAYAHKGAVDTEALKRIMAIEPSDTKVEERWEASLKAVGWKHCATFAQLASKWTEFATVVTEKQCRVY